MPKLSTAQLLAKAKENVAEEILFRYIESMHTKKLPYDEGGFITESERCQSLLPEKQLKTTLLWLSETPMPDGQYHALTQYYSTKGCYFLWEDKLPTLFPVNADDLSGVLSSLLDNTVDEESDIVVLATEIPSYLRGHLISFCRTFGIHLVEPLYLYKEGSKEFLQWERVV